MGLGVKQPRSMANPATTMRSYIDPLDTGMVRRAASVLDQGVYRRDGMVAPITTRGTVRSVRDGTDVVPG
ncbi:MAG: hypothetical protein M3Y91_07150 [Actinomycetota bacterium]|nr:hypothetical protein [Actinomycetota bacterium]